ncbi:GntR family transcriptional regulator [Propionivibrio dicarboxylicus]|uniref:DNA-binding transcriptional regulator, GntR family n=1 Tax=Propionivibrio dicarboxylicus TaxID=83767 RepID=A0A1G7W3D5_9RHOO|nr:GntR family transcriptional regulator [Propionivibrio dicarboxylicus]SDG65700.1 DNA-binding transcriptional regulator, GntR family [Propionivibrio dicarboxylicus]
MNTQDAAIPSLDSDLADGAITPIDRPTLHSVVVSRLRDMIIEGVLLPGTRINEGQLGQQLGVSRTPLREALKVLAMEGLVELVPGRGAMVCVLTAKDVRDMLEVLSSLEHLAGTLTCQNASDAQIGAVRTLHDEMLAFYRSGDRLQYFKKNQQIHSALIVLAGNASLAMVHDILQSKMRRIRYLGDQNDDTWSGAVADHEEMIAALEARDGPRLSAALVDHLTRTWDRVKDAI